LQIVSIRYGIVHKLKNIENGMKFILDILIERPTVLDKIQFYLSNEINRLKAEIERKYPKGRKYD